LSELLTALKIGEKEGGIDKNTNKKQKGGNMPKQIVVSNKSRAQKVKVTFY